MQKPTAPPPAPFPWIFFSFMIVFINAFTCFMISWSIFRQYSNWVHDYDKYQENPNQRHVANLNMELKALSRPMYCIGNLLMSASEILSLGVETPPQNSSARSTDRSALSEDVRKFFWGLQEDGETWTDIIVHPIRCTYKEPPAYI
jgi:hypothetical protein